MSASEPLIHPAPTPVAEGFRLPEGPRWHDGALWFVDMLNGHVNRLDDGRVETYATFDHPSAIGFRPDGDLVVVDANERAIRTMHGGEVAHSVDLSDRCHHLNDMILDKQGWVYVDAYQSDAFVHGWQADGQILLVKPDGDVSVAAEGILGPNGIAIAPDGKTLVVGESMGPGGSPNGARLLRYRIASDGTLDYDSVAGTIERGSGDGLVFDSEGGIWVGCSFGHEVQRFVDGEVVERVRLPEKRWALACALGGPEMRTLYICSVPRPPKGQPAAMTGGTIGRVEVSVPGVVA